MNKFLLSLALGAVGMLLTPGDSQAQRWGGGRSGFGISIGNAGYYNGGYGYNGYGYNGYGYNRGYGYNGWGYSPGYGYSGWGYSPGYGYSNWSNYPSYSNYSYPSYSYMPSTYSGTYYSTPAYSSALQPSVNTTTSFYRSPEDQLATTMMDKATIEVTLPENAELWLDGQPTTQRGATRTFESPPLQVGNRFTYEFRARWMQDGQAKEDVRQVDAFAGAKQKINFGNK